MSMIDRQPEENPTTIFILGILGITVCGICGIFAWIQGNAYERSCLRLGVKPEGLATAGRILGMVGVFLMIAGVVLGGVFVLLSLAAQ